ncbi:MAG: DUF3617 domain-containing protein [Pseudomonadota bacterium]
MHKIIALAFLTIATSAQSAETNMRPGLWEIATTSDLLLLVPHIPAEQMQSIKDLATEYGFEVPPIENGAAISKACITPEMASQKSPPIFAQNQLGCVTKNSTRTGNNYQMDFVCESADLKGTGSAEGSIVSAESFTGKTRFNGSAQGNVVNEQADISGKWISASCGDTKPL